MAENEISGYAVLYNEPTTIAGQFIEKVAPGAFKNLKDVSLLWSHDPDLPLARTVSGTLSLKDTRAGLYFYATLDPNNPDAARALSAIGRTDVRGMSFGFIIRKEEWQASDDYDELPVRTILEADIIEISAVLFPAYKATSVGLVRSDAMRAKVAPSTPAKSPALDYAYRRARFEQKARGISG